MVKGHCKNCNKQMGGIKSKFSWMTFIFLFGWIWGYPIYYWFFKPKDKCPICGLRINIWKKK